MDNFLELCRSRRSIRKYTRQPVEQEKIDYLMRCALMSPSGKRINPWEFFVVKDEAKLRKMSLCRTMGSGMFKTAMAGIVVAVDTSLTELWMCDGAIAAQNILLAAEEQGLGACWCQIYGREADASTGCTKAEEVIRQAVEIPENLTVLCVISLGYKDEERKQYDLEKLLYNKVHNA
ncbi:MAG: nitroreductase family protein [Paludibacteraceae bacterium]|nr:nitroreductase family protein [Paludibacteraceae bacterium]